MKERQQHKRITMKCKLVTVNLTSRMASLKICFNGLLKLPRASHETIVSHKAPRRRRKPPERRGTNCYYYSFYVLCGKETFLAGELSTSVKIGILVLLLVYRWLLSDFFPSIPDGILPEASSSSLQVFPSLLPSAASSQSLQWRKEAELSGWWL